MKARAPKAAPVNASGATRVVVRTKVWERDTPTGDASAPGASAPGATRAQPEPNQIVDRRPDLGGFLMLTTAAYSLATVAFLVLAAAGLFGALDHNGRIIGVGAIALMVGCGAIVRWLVHRPEGYPRTKPRSEIALAWLALGIPASLVGGLVVVLAVLVGSVLVQAIFEVDAAVQLRPLAMRVGVGCIVCVLIGMVRALRR